MKYVFKIIQLFTPECNYYSKQQNRAIKLCRLQNRTSNAGLNSNQQIYGVNNRDNCKKILHNLNPVIRAQFLISIIIF